jgi:hypothetical protein
MSDWRIGEQQLLHVNTVLQRADDVLVTNCVTRTAQESKLFPILPYLDLVMIESYWRFPDILRQVAAERTPEDLGHRLREVSTTVSRLTSWAILNYYINGRSLLIRNGLIRPEDNLEDLCFMVDFHQRFIRAYQRSNAHVWADDAGDVVQTLEERSLQVLEADAFEADDALRSAAVKFVAAATQFNFLVHCESRSGLAAAGPYQLGGTRLLHTRDFLNMSECGLSWMDCIADDMPYANLTVSLITDGVSMEITDWASPYTSPEDYQDGIIGVGLYTSDLLCDRYVPVGMGSARELADTFAQLTQQISAATRNLYSRFAEMTFEQMVEAGMHTYLRAPADLSMVAGVYSQTAWDLVDDRTRRLSPIYNEEYALDAYVDNFAGMMGRAGSASDYYLHPVSYGIWRRGGGKERLPAPGRNAFLVPARVLDVDDYPRRVNPNGLADVRGSTTLPAKTGRYAFAGGRLTEDELNEHARSFSSPLFAAPWRHIDEQTVKWHWQEPEVDALYRYTQEHSRLLKDRGSSLRRRDLDSIRREAGERPWSEVAESSAPLQPTA